MKNSIPAGFLKKYRKGKKGAVIYLPLGIGFLRLKYAEEGKVPLLRVVALVAHHTEQAHAIGMQLEFNLNADEDDEQATWGAEGSGMQWCGGEVRSNTALNTSAPPPQGRKISLDDWVDECLDKMINPSGTILSEMKEHFDINTIIAQVRAGDGKAAERFCKQCIPHTDDEVTMVLALLKSSLENNDGDLIFVCAEPLKRSVTGHKRILEELTALLESMSITHDYDRSEIYEVIVALSSAADTGLVNRWIEICKAALAHKGLAALHTINDGHLFEALAELPEPNNALMNFFDEVMACIKALEPEMRAEVQDLHFYSAMRRIARKHQ